MMKKFIIGLMTAIIAIMTLSSCACTVIDNSEVGVEFKKFGMTDQGKLDAVPATGYTFYNPITTSVFRYPIYAQTADYDAFNVKTRDGAEFTMDPELVYWVERDKAVDIFTKFRKKLPDIEDTYILTCVKDAYRIVGNAYNSDELMANRSQFEDAVEEMLTKSLTEEGFHVDKFTMDILPPKSLQAAIDAKNEAIQAALKAENEVKAAEANAKIAVAKARGEGEAMKIKADAEAYYNRTISASLSALIVQEDWIEKWDGKLPQVSGGNTPLIQIPK